MNVLSEQKYEYTDLSLNGHTVRIKDRSYVDNVMLKKPYTTEDDLDFIISKLYGVKPLETATKRQNYGDISDETIQSKVSPNMLPISLRKRLLINSVKKAFL